VRRSLFPLLAALLTIVSLLPLGCGENMVAKETREARAEFQQVVAMVKEVQEGFLRSEKGLAALGTHAPSLIKFDDPAIVAAMKSGQLRAYQIAVIDQIEGKLKNLVTRGQTSQRIAAHQLLASLYLASSAHDRREAMIVSDALSPQAAAIETFLSSIESNSSLIGVLTDDEKPVLEKWNQNQEVVTAAVAKFKGDAQTLKSEIDDLQKQIDVLTAKRDDAFKQASTLRTQALQKKNIEEYELHIKAIDAERDGQSSDTKIDELTVTQDLAKAKLALLERELGIAQKWSETLASGVGDVEKRQEAMKALESDIVRYRAESAANLAGDLKQLTEDYDQKVTVKLDGALAKTVAAVETLQKADALAKGDEKASVKFELLDAMLSKLSAQADAIVATNRFATIGGQVKARTGQALSGDAAELATNIEEAKARQASLVDESRKTVAELNALFADASISGIKEGTTLGDARIARIKSARTLVAGHAARIGLYGGSAPVAAPIESETPAAPVDPAAPVAPAAPAAPAVPVDPAAPVAPDANN